MGKKRQPSYRVVVVEAASKRDGKTLAEIGHFYPVVEPEELVIDVEAALAWLRKGAQPTPAARRLLSRAGVMKAFHEERFGKSSGAPQAEAPAAPEQPGAETKEEQ